MKRKFFKIITIIAALLVILFIALPSILVSLHYGMYLEEMNNEIVNHRYPNWKDAALDDKLSIKLPEKWNIVTNATGDLNIVDDEGTVIAVGEQKQYYDTSDMIEHYIELKTGARVVAHEVVQRDYMRWSTDGFNCIWRMTLDDGNFIDAEVLSISYYDEYVYDFCFLPGSINEEDPPFTVEAEAIAWSALNVDRNISWFTRRALFLV